LGRKEKKEGVDEWSSFFESHRAHRTQKGTSNGGGEGNRLQKEIERKRRKEKEKSGKNSHPEQKVKRRIEKFQHPLYISTQHPCLEEEAAAAGFEESSVFFAGDEEETAGEPEDFALESRMWRLMA